MCSSKGHFHGACGRIPEEGVFFCLGVGIRDQHNHKAEQSIMKNNQIAIIRKTIKVIIAACCVFGAYQIIPLAMLKREISLFEHQIAAAKESQTHWENQGQSIKAEIDEKNSWGSVVAGFGESFFNGFTFGVFDSNGIFGPSRRLERWESDIRSRIAEVQTGYENATRELETAQERHMSASAALQHKVSARNISGIVAVIAILVLVYLPKSSKTAS